MYGFLTQSPKGVVLISYLDHEMRGYRTAKGDISVFSRVVVAIF